MNSDLSKTLQPSEALPLMEPIPVEVSQTQRQQSMPYDVSTKSFTQVNSISSYSPFVLPSNFQEMGIQVSDPDIVTNETCGSASQRGLSEDEIQTYLASMPKKEYSTTVTLDNCPVWVYCENCGYMSPSQPRICLRRSMLVLMILLTLLFFPIDRDRGWYFIIPLILLIITIVYNCKAPIKFNCGVCNKYLGKTGDIVLNSPPLIV
ncbi:hypothetical protein AV274_4736 [Blastocystis sp. ATCC 50177/Nand II]|uniref:LITAF domain-containing protein n=1 Tax=Blastocystis sp. subtype 1 (strain ATCC 50177 / NandII) TaxID=478820 RepID=A0A196S913_BLAHN|nr:hypothetical protein AV274_4736 [Blastocystis sp. ATCC 50177/Nand II]